MNNRKRNKEKIRGTEAQEVGVILEDVASKMDLVLEGYTALDSKIDALGENLNNKIDTLREDMNARFEQVDARFEQVDKRFEQVDARFEQVFDELHVIRNDLKEKVGRDEFVLLEKRVSALERTQADPRLKARG